MPSRARLAASGVVRFSRRRGSNSGPRFSGFRKADDHAIESAVDLVRPIRVAVQLHEPIAD
jgi:hypothetical protein